MTYIVIPEDKNRFACHMAEITCEENRIQFVPSICTGRSDDGTPLIIPVFYHKDVSSELQCIRFEKHFHYHEATFLTRIKNGPVNLSHVVLLPPHRTKYGKYEIARTNLYTARPEQDQFLTRPSDLEKGETVPVVYVTLLEEIRLGHRAGIGGGQEIFVPDMTVQNYRGSCRMTILYDYVLRHDGEIGLSFMYREPLYRLQIKIKPGNYKHIEERFTKIVCPDEIGGDAQ